MGGVEERAWNWLSKWFTIDIAALIPLKVCYGKVFGKSLSFLEWIFNGTLWGVILWIAMDYEGY